MCSNFQFFIVMDWNLLIGFCLFKPLLSIFAGDHGVCWYLIWAGRGFGDLLSSMSDSLSPIVYCSVGIRSVGVFLPSQIMFGSGSFAASSVTHDCPCRKCRWQLLVWDGWTFSGLISYMFAGSACWGSRAIIVLGSALLSWIM